MNEDEVGSEGEERGMAFTRPLRDRSGDNQLLLERNSIVVSIEHDLRGHVFDENTEKWMQGSATLMNEEGINAVISLIRSSVNTGVILSDLSDADINAMCLDLNYELIDLIKMSWKTFDIRRELMSMIVAKTMWLIYCSLRSARNHGYQEFLTKSRQEVVRRDFVEPGGEKQVKKGLWPF